MRIPPFYQRASWQRFFGGIVIGALISWFVFIFQYGVFQEKQVKIITKQQDRITNLEQNLETLMENNSKLNEENKSKLKIQDFKVQLVDAEKFNLAPLQIHKITDDVLKELNHLIAMDIESLTKNKELLRKAIENKPYEIDDKIYKLQLYAVYFDTTLELSLKITLAN
ncbi:sporulation membrane protein YtrI [Bacillus sp. PS06]|uniref:sporulation membrane protein YtrI n=1 Tax=Bacillus sp. PS06 TaxID=2764176 RepID=UPI0017849731|nr:sporulation membrane protein YtrI [Bacillus sp. PS06]MBD8068960.1 sporulation protein [Bacillus sp. PS06]